MQGIPRADLVITATKASKGNCQNVGFNEGSWLVRRHGVDGMFMNTAVPPHQLDSPAS